MREYFKAVAKKYIADTPQAPLYSLPVLTLVISSLDVTARRISCEVGVLMSRNVIAFRPKISIKMERPMTIVVSTANPLKHSACLLILFIATLFKYAQKTVRSR